MNKRDEKHVAAARNLKLNYMLDDDNCARETYTTFFSPRFFPCETFWNLASLPTSLEMQSDRLDELQDVNEENVPICHKHSLFR